MRRSNCIAHRQFAEAADRFESTQQEIGGEDFLCDMYLARCAAYI